MKLKILEQQAQPYNPVSKHFALFPTIVKEVHPTHIRSWLIWLDWYETDRRFIGKWLPFFKPNDINK